MSEGPFGLPARGPLGIPWSIYIGSTVGGWATPMVVSSFTDRDPDIVGAAVGGAILGAFVGYVAHVVKTAEAAPPLPPASEGKILGLYPATWGATLGAALMYTQKRRATAVDLLTGFVGGAVVGGWVGEYRAKRRLAP